MPSTIRQRLLRVEEDLLDAIIGEESAMNVLTDSWASLCTDLQMALDARLLDEDTRHLAHITASRVQIIAESFMEIRSQADAMAFSPEVVESMLSSLTLSKNNEGTTTRDSLSPTPGPSPRCTITSYIRTAYEWLIRNLHNPYPPKHVKEAIACDTGSAIKDLDNWFIDARRRIGWNQLRRKRFSNKRQEIVRAATKFFTGAGCPESLDPDTEMEFAAIEASAFQLYPNKITSRHELAEQTSDSSDTSANSRPRTRRGKPDNNGLRPPSPAHELAIHSGANCSRTNNSRKRHFDHDTIDSEPEIVSSLKPRKQPKLNHGSGCQQQGTWTSLPSITTPIRQPVRRKRGLSQGEDHPNSAKRPCNNSSPQAHAVSDALFYDVPLDTSALDAWFQINWDITQPFDIASNDSERDDLRLELFNPSQSVSPMANLLPQTNELTHSNTVSKTFNNFIEPDALPELDATSIASTSSSPSSHTNLMPSIDNTSDLDRWTDSSDIHTAMQNLSWLLNTDVTDHLLPPIWEENPSMGILQDPNTLFNFDIATCGELSQVDLGLTSLSTTRSSLIPIHDLFNTNHDSYASPSVSSLMQLLYIYHIMNVLNLF
ncbi:hypothetical protein APHAL10511_006025 [Amanita phalloides]|nr:hypothetical protein APHAL10511_006025 [Amanita phalloides]